PAFLRRPRPGRPLPPRRAGEAHAPCALQRPRRPRARAARYRLFERDRVRRADRRAAHAARLAPRGARAPVHDGLPRGVIMRSKVLNEKGERSYALVFDTGDEPVSLLTRFAEEH